MLHETIRNLAQNSVRVPCGQRNYDGDGKENVEKVVGLISKTTTLHVHHTFLYIS